METEYPYSDDDMEYDKNIHQYILTENYCVNELCFPMGLGLNNTNTTKSSSSAKRFLKRVSSVVYRYIYKHTTNEALVEFIIAKDPKIRDLFLEALSEQLLYMRKNGDLNLYSGVDFKKGTYIDLDYNKAISPITKDILDECGLLFCGERRFPIYFKYREDY